MSGNYSLGLERSRLSSRDRKRVNIRNKAVEYSPR